jgi:transposase
MMGRLNHDQGQFFYSLRLEDAVPGDHPVRDIAVVLDLSWVYSELEPFYPKIGRPWIDPVLMIRMLIIGYLFAIRSERALCRDLQVNLAYRWFCGLSIEDKVPDHSNFSRARHDRFGASDVFRRVFGRVVEGCIAAGLVGGEGFAVDASLIAADANKQRSIPGPEWNKARDPQGASRAVREYLATLDGSLAGTIVRTKQTTHITDPHLGDSGGESATRARWAFANPPASKFIGKSDCPDVRALRGSPAKITVHTMPPNIAQAATNPS